jgi:hypothetical protein
MQGPRGLHHNTPRNLGEVRAANHGGWQPTLAYRDRQSCAARKRRSLLVSCIIRPVRPGPSRPNKRARVFSIQSAVNASMVESSDYELGGLEQVARAGVDGSHCKLEDHRPRLVVEAQLRASTIEIGRLTAAVGLSTQTRSQRHQRHQRQMGRQYIQVGLRLGGQMGSGHDVLCVRAQGRPP